MSKCKQVDQPSVIKHLIMQHVQEDINRPDYRKLAEEINGREWVIMKGHVHNDNEPGSLNVMCRIINAHGEYATLQLCWENSEAYSCSPKIVVIHLSKWSEYYVEWHTDFYRFCEHMGSVGTTHIGKD